MNATLDFLSKTDWEYKEVANKQYNVKVCPLCSDERWKFYISFEGLWDCKICAEKGNLYQLKGKLGGIDEITSVSRLFENKKELDIEALNDYIADLNKDKEAYEYLTKVRGFTPETIEKFKLGVDGDWIVIPHFQDRKLWNLKMRNYKEKDFRRVSGQPSILFNIDNVDISKKALVIVESETDCIAATQLGIKNVVGLSTGAGTFLPEWIPFTLKFKEIYICLNSDQPGQKGAYSMAEKLGLEKCKNVILPTKDVNDYLHEHSGEDFYELVKNAKRFNIKNIKDVAEYIKEIDEWLDGDDALNGLQLPFPTLNKYLHGFKEEDLIIVSGDTGVGKTTINFNFIHHFLNNGHRCLVFLLEGKIKYHLLRMISAETKIKTDDIMKDKSIIPEWEKLKLKFSDYPLYFYSGAQADINPKKLGELLLAACKMYDIDFVLIDNLQKFVKGDNEQVVQETSRTVSAVKDYAVDLKIPIVLISHIRKPEKERKRVTMHDAKSSSTIYQDADVYLTLWNNKGKNEDIDDMIISIDKNRMGEGGIDIDMIYEKDIGTYRERSGDAEPKKKKRRETIVSWKEKGFDEEKDKENRKEGIK